MVFVLKPYFAPQAQKFPRGTWFSVTKYVIKHPVVYFSLSELTLKNSSDIYVMRHIMTKIIGT